MKSKRLVVILIGLAFVAVAIVATIFAFTVKQVKGEFSLINQDASKVQSTLDNYTGTNLLFLNTDEIVSEVEKNPYLEVTKVEKQYPNVIMFEIRERKEVYLFEYNEKTYILDDEGIVLSELTDEREINERNYIWIKFDKSLDNLENTVAVSGEIVFGEKLITDSDDTFYKSLSLAKLVGLTDCIKVVNVYKKAELNEVFFETYTGVIINVRDIATRGEEKTLKAFDDYKNEEEDYLKSFDTILVYELDEVDLQGNKVLEVKWTSRDA